MWVLVVTVMGMSVYSNTYPSLGACEAAGRAKAIALVAQGRTAQWSCTRSGGASTGAGSKPGYRRRW